MASNAHLPKHSRLYLHVLIPYHCFSFSLFHLSNSEQFSKSNNNRRWCYSCNKQCGCIWLSSKYDTNFGTRHPMVVPRWTNWTTSSTKSTESASTVQSTPANSSRCNTYTTTSGTYKYFNKIHFISIIRCSVHVIPYRYTYINVVFHPFIEKQYFIW